MEFSINSGCIRNDNFIEVLYFSYTFLVFLVTLEIDTKHLIKLRILSTISTYEFTFC